MTKRRPLRAPVLRIRHHPRGLTALVQDAHARRLSLRSGLSVTFQGFGVALSGVVAATNQDVVTFN